MDFPQYLWTIAVREGPLLIRRGATPEEAIAKFERKDRAWALEHLVPEVRREPFVVGVLPVCAVNDAERYSAAHPWDWMRS